MDNARKIAWIKNVKRNNGEGWAYADVLDKPTFKLHWPTKKKGTASTPSVGDIIVLFQKPNIINGKRNYKVHLTHLVTPVSNVVKEDEMTPDHKWYRDVKLIAIANPIEAIPNPGYFNFYLANRGLTNPIKNLENRKGWDVEQTKDIIWSLFNNFICEYEDDDSEPNLLSDNDSGYVEGDPVSAHIDKEVARRNSYVVLEAKKRALKNGNGHILCECCGFDFLEFYGELGNGFIECHHKKFICDGERITRITDLAMVCPNCHRMLHKNMEGRYYTVEELKKFLDNR